MAVGNYWDENQNKWVEFTGPVGDEGPVGGREIVDSAVEPDLQPGGLWLDPTETAPQGTASTILEHDHRDVHEVALARVQLNGKQAAIAGIWDTGNLVRSDTHGLDNRSLVAPYSPFLAQNNFTLTNGDLTLVRVNPVFNIATTQFVFSTGSIASVSPTLYRLGLYTIAGTGDLTLVASCASIHSSVTGTNTSYSPNMTTPINTVTYFEYCIGILAVGQSTPGNVASISLRGLSTSLPKPFAWKISSQTDLPSTISFGALSISDDVPFLGVMP